MNLSLDEYRALVAKAFRGAGYPWGLTEEAAFAARRLAEFNAPSGEMVIRLLERVDHVPLRDRMPTADWASTADVLCSICVGTALADQAGLANHPGSLELNRVSEPILIAPFLEAAMDTDGPGSYRITWSGGVCEVSTASISTTGDLPTEPVDVLVERISVDTTGGVEAIRPTVNRVELANETMQALEQFAHRTYAPATEASRQGAGPA